MEDNSIENGGSHKGLRELIQDQTIGEDCLYGFDFLQQKGNFQFSRKWRNSSKFSPFTKKQNSIQRSFPITKERFHSLREIEDHSFANYPPFEKAFFIQKVHIKWRIIRKAKLKEHSIDDSIFKWRKMKDNSIENGGRQSSILVFSYKEKWRSIRNFITLRLI